MASSKTSTRRSESGAKPTDIVAAGEVFFALHDFNPATVFDTDGRATNTLTIMLPLARTRCRITVEALPDSGD